MQLQVYTRAPVARTSSKMVCSAIVQRRPARRSGHSRGQRTTGEPDQMNLLRSKVNRWQPKIGRVLQRIITWVLASPALSAWLNPTWLGLSQLHHLDQRLALQIARQRAEAEAARSWPASRH
jgi:hypothetical protein